MEVVQYDKPTDRVRAFIRDYAKQLYGIEDASALMPLVEIAFDGNAGNNERISAARELLKYSEVPTRSIEYDNGQGDNELGVEILGVCEIVEPENKDPQQLASSSSSDSSVELHDEGREASG